MKCNTSAPATRGLWLGPVRPFHGERLPLRPQPLKHDGKRVKSHAMTVGIALECVLWDGSRGFVLCADTELSGTGVKDDRGDKFYRLGNNFMALMAGTWGTVTQLTERIANAIAPSIPRDEEDLKWRVLEPSQRFVKSEILFPKGSQPCEVIITGFMGEKPVMLYVYAYPRGVTVDFQRHHWTIGTGGSAAGAMIGERGFTPLASLEKALYVAYEAKRLSERISGVGRGTKIMIHGQTAETATKRSLVCADYVSEAGLARLEVLRSQFFVREIAQIDRFPVEYLSGPYPFKS